MIEKEPGQLAYEAWASAVGWKLPWPKGCDAYAWATVETAIRADERERCAKIAEPKAPRPCDCDRCYCQNYDDAQAVAAWDADNYIAAAIRAGETP